MIRPGLSPHFRSAAERLGLTRANARKLRPRIRVRRRTLALLTLLACIAIAAAFWATLRQTALLRETLQDQLSVSFGAKVTIDKVEWNGWSTIRAEGLTLRVPGWVSPADEVASIERAVVIFEPTSLLGGRLNLVDIEIDGLTLRVIEDAAKPGMFNLLALKPAPASGGAVGQPQKALMRDLRLQLGVLRNGRVDLVAQRAFTGAFEHVVDDPSKYAFELSQVEVGSSASQPVQPSAAPIRLFGTWDERTFAYEVTMDSLPISPETIALLPLQGRTWAQTSRLAGRIESARISGNPTDLVSFAEVHVRDVTMRERDVVRTVPWARMVGDDIQPIRGDVSVHLPKGTLTVRGSKVKITANDARLMPGTPGSGAVDIPVELSLSVDLASNAARPFNWDATEEWLTDTLNAAPFDLRVKLSGVSALPGSNGQPRPVELPLPLVDVLREFGARDWLADIDLTASRGRATIEADGSVSPSPLAVQGRLALSDGTVRYDAFPYQLDQVTGVIEFKGTTATITDLVGHGSGDATLRIGGTVSLEDQTDPAFDVRIVATDVPADDRLMQGLDPLTKDILASLLDREAFQSLRAANLSDDTWQPGGLVGFDLRVSHESHGARGTVVEGDIHVHEAQVVIDSFPYPLRVKGDVHLKDEVIVLAGDGFAAVTPTGATGVVSGRIDTPGVGPTRRVETHLAFDFKDEKFSALLLAAIPVRFDGDEPAPEGWPGRVRAPIAELLTELGASGTLAIKGTVRTDSDGDSRVDTTISIADGAVNPTQQLPKVLRRIGLSWPAQMNLTDVAGTINLSPEGLEIPHLSAHRGTGRADARGSFSTDGVRGELHVDLSSFPLSRDFIGVAEGADLASAYRAWDALKPGGTFDGRVEWRHDGDSVSTTAEARLTSFTVAGDQALDAKCGEFIYRDGAVTVKELDLRGIGPTGNEIAITADGTIVGETPQFVAAVRGLTMAAPLVDAGLRAGGQEGIADTMREFHLDGGFEAQLDVGTLDSGGNAWRLRVDPTWVAGTAHGDPFSVVFHGGAIEAGPEGVRFSGLHAGMMHGLMSLHGTIGVDAGGATTGDLLLGMQLAQWSPDLEALLPLTAREALRGIEFGAEGPVTTDGLRIRFETPPGGSPNVQVDGPLEIASGRFRAGTGFTNADGVLSFALKTQSGNPSGAIDLDFSRLFVVNREATDVHARLAFDGKSDSVTLRDMEAWMYDGRLTGRAHAVMGGDYKATVTFVNVRFAPFAEATDTPEQRTQAWTARGYEEGPGRMRGRFELSGAFGRPELQRGTGRVTVADARMIEFPLGMSILQLSQLMLPINASLERADAQFAIVGDVLTFEKFELASSTLRLEGSGSLSLADGDLALRFRNRGTLPLVSDLFGAVVGDQMFMIDVGGTLKDPQPHLVPIPILAPEPSLPVASAAKDPSTHD